MYRYYSHITEYVLLNSCCRHCNPSPRPSPRPNPTIITAIIIIIITRQIQNSLGHDSISSLNFKETKITFKNIIKIFIRQSYTIPIMM